MLTGFVVKFNPIDESRTFIGPDLGAKVNKWYYCAPFNSDRVLKIDTQSGSVTTIQAILPEQGSWSSAALAPDGCIYFMPYYSRRILRLDPITDTIGSVGIDFGRGLRKFSGTVVGVDGNVYGIPFWSRRIAKYDPIDGRTSFIGDESEDRIFDCTGNGVLGRDGHIYAFMEIGQVLKIDTAIATYSFVGDIMKVSSNDKLMDAALGNDGCIYWAPSHANRVLKYDPRANNTFYVGNDLGNRRYKWSGGAVTSTGVICCTPWNANRVLIIDPFEDFIARLYANMERYPEKLGLLFTENNGVTEYESATVKFGTRKVSRAIMGILPSANEVFPTSNLYPCLLAASHPDIALWFIYHLFRQVPSIVNCPTNHGE